MTYKHKKNKCFKETKEILEEVLNKKEEAYRCIDCAEAIHLENPMEQIITEEIDTPDVRNPTNAIFEETVGQDDSLLTPEANLESYQTLEELEVPDEKEIIEISKKGKKNGAYSQLKDKFTG